MSGDSRAARLRGDLVLLAGFAALKLGIHFYFSSYYGYQRDELYFIACGERIAWGYVDVGLLTPWLGRLGRAMLGESLFALRFFPALAGAGTVFLTGWLARMLGGGRLAQSLACLSVLIAPVWLLGQNLLSLPAFEPVFWVGCACLLVRLFETGDRRLWLWVGVVAGIGLLNKPSMAFFGFALAGGLLLTPHRRHLASGWLWAGAGIALLIVTPTLLWQAANGWPTWQFLYNLNRDVMTRVPRYAFLVGQLAYMHPVNAPLWLTGLAFFLFMRAGRTWRPLGWVYVLTFLFMVTAHSKIYYLAPAYPMLLAAGAVTMGNGLSRARSRWPRAAVPVVMVVGGLVTAPVGLPILPVQKIDGYASALTGGLLADAYELTGTFHDQFGWENMVRETATVYHALPAEARVNAVVFGRNFGHAGALDFWREAYGLPPVYSIHQNFFFWGPPPDDAEPFITLGFRRELLEPFFADVTLAAVSIQPDAVRSEQEVAIHVCRGALVPLSDAWPTFRAVAFDN